MSCQTMVVLTIIFSPHVRHQFFTCAGLIDGCHILKVNKTECIVNQVPLDRFEKLPDIPDITQKLRKFAMKDRYILFIKN